MLKGRDCGPRDVPEKPQQFQYENLMRKFSECHKEDCKAVAVDIPKESRRVKQFPTGSQYEGTWDVLGMSGGGTYTFPNVDISKESRRVKRFPTGSQYEGTWDVLGMSSGGTYTFPNGVIYEGGFDDGMFHGEGELRYPSGEVVMGQFNQGSAVERTLMFTDGLQYTENDWLYCQMPDRRYTIEYEKGIPPSGQSNLTPEQPPREIPPGYYDTGDGFYDPETKMVYKSDDLDAIVRSPSLREQKWILENCRTAPNVQIGPRPDLYEDWLQPELEGVTLPLPASVSRACMYMFEEPVSEEDFHTDSEDVIEHWQDILDDSTDAVPLRRLKFQPSKDIKRLTLAFDDMKSNDEMEEN